MKRDNERYVNRHTIHRVGTESHDTHGVQRRFVQICIAAGLKQRCFDHRSFSADVHAKDGRPRNATLCYYTWNPKF